VASGENLTLSMGLVKQEGVRVGDRVWLDEDRDGIQDDGETGIPAVVVQLYEVLGTEPVGITMTDGDGTLSKTAGMIIFWIAMWILKQD